MNASLPFLASRGCLYALVHVALAYVITRRGNINQMCVHSLVLLSIVPTGKPTS